MSVVSYNITSDGKLISETYKLLYIDVKTEYNRIPYAELGFIDGDLAKQEYKISESADFEPGKEIEIKLGYNGTKPSDKPQVVFKGIVLKQSLQQNQRGCILVAELNDTAVRMTFGRKSNVFENIKDNAIISKLISNNGLQAGSVDATTVQHKKIVQYACTDWDFMLSRAEANSLLLSVNAGILTAKAPDLTGIASAKYTI